MNRDVLESQWTEVREILKDKFSNLTDEDLRQINGRYDQLVAKLQQKYGYTREEAEERIRAFNFDRFTGSRAHLGRDEKIAREERVIRRDEETSSSFPGWLLALGIPLLLLAAYFLSYPPETARTTTAPTATQQAIVNETAADSAISNGIRNALVSQNVTPAQLQNVTITTNNAVVTLSGFVANEATSDLIEDTAEDFAGVRSVTNNLEIR